MPLALAGTCIYVYLPHRHTKQHTVPPKGQNYINGKSECKHHLFTNKIRKTAHTTHFFHKNKDPGNGIVFKKEERKKKKVYIEYPRMDRKRITEPITRGQC